MFQSGQQLHGDAAPRAVRQLLVWADTCAATQKITEVAIGFQGTIVAFLFAVVAANIVRKVTDGGSEKKEENIQLYVFYLNSFNLQ